MCAREPAQACSSLRGGSHAGRPLAQPAPPPSAPQLFCGLILVSPSCQRPGWWEWGWGGVACRQLWHQGWGASVKQYFVQRLFGELMQQALGGESDLLQARVQRSSSRPATHKPANIAGRGSGEAIACAPQRSCPPGICCSGAGLPTGVRPAAAAGGVSLPARRSGPARLPGGGAQDPLPPAACLRRRGAAQGGLRGAGHARSQGAVCGAGGAPGRWPGWGGVEEMAGQGHPVPSMEVGGAFFPR